jgi:hypothetical protein
MEGRKMISTLTDQQLNENFEQACADEDDAAVASVLAEIERREQSKPYAAEYVSPYAQ